MGKKRRRSRAFKESNQVIDFEDERQKRKVKRQQVTEKRKGRREAPAPESGRRTGKKVRRRLIYCGIAVIIVCVIGYSVCNIVTLREARVRAEEELAALEKEKNRLAKELSLADSDEYIEEKARDELHMIRQGEKIYVLPSAGETSDSAAGIVEITTPAAVTSAGALVLTGQAVDGGDDGDGENWLANALTGIKDTFHAVAEQLKNLVRK